MARGSHPPPGGVTWGPRESPTAQGSHLRPRGVTRSLGEALTAWGVTHGPGQSPAAQAMHNSTQEQPRRDSRIKTLGDSQVFLE